MTNPASKPASSPTRTHVANMTKLMTPPPSPGYGSPASLPLHRCTRRASSPFAPVGWTRAQAPLTAGGDRQRPVPVLHRPEGRRHFARPPGHVPGLHHHPHGGAHDAPVPLGRPAGADADV